MYQVAFTVDVLPRSLPWLLLNRHGLSVLIHPNTGLGARRPYLARAVARSTASLAERQPAERARRGKHQLAADQHHAGSLE